VRAQQSQKIVHAAARGILGLDHTFFTLRANL
jgi:hypothetical protein